MGWKAHFLIFERIFHNIPGSRSAWARCSPQHRINDSILLVLDRSTFRSGTERRSWFLKTSDNYSGPHPSIHAKNEIVIRLIILFQNKFSHLAWLVTWGAVSFRLLEIVHIDISCIWTSDYLVPLDCLDVAEVVVVENPDGATQDVWKIM